MTEADETLIAEVAALGQTVTARQLKDLRAHKLIRSAQGPGAGRGRGRPSRAYPAGTAERVAQIRRIQTTRRNVKLAELPIWLFLDGSDADLEEARALLLEWHTPIVAQYPNPAKHDPDQIADEFTRFVPTITSEPSIRFLKHLLEIRSAQPTTGFWNLFESLLWATMGEPLSRDAQKQLIHAMPGNLPEIANGLETVLHDINMFDLARKIAEATRDDLIWARDLRRRVILLQEEWIRLLTVEPAPDVDLSLIVDHDLWQLDPYSDMLMVIAAAYFRPIFERLQESVIRTITCQIHNEQSNQIGS